MFVENLLQITYFSDSYEETKWKRVDYPKRPSPPLKFIFKVNSDIIVIITICNAFVEDYIKDYLIFR